MTVANLDLIASFVPCNGHAQRGTQGRLCVSDVSIRHLSSNGRSFVSDVEDLLLLPQAAIGNSEFWLVEGLVCVKAHPIASSVLVSVLVLLSSPVLAIPELSVAFIARGVGVGPLGDDKLCAVFEGAVWVPRSQVGSVMNLWAFEACPGSRCEVVSWLMVGGGIHHGSCAVTTGGGVEGDCQTCW